MIVDNPSDALLASADTIALFDLKWASWHEVIVPAPSQPRSGNRFTVLDIPVDSTDAAAVQDWRDRIAAARKP
jgi:hypothetical protein